MFTQNDDKNRKQICLRVCQFMMLVVLLQPLKWMLLPFSQYQVIMLHSANVTAHLVLFSLVLICLKYQWWKLARVLLIFSFSSFLIIACVLWGTQLYIHFYFLLSMFICVYLFDKNEQAQLWFYTGLNLACFLGFSLYFTNKPALNDFHINVAQTNALSFAVSCLLCAFFIRHLLSHNWQTLLDYERKQQSLLNRIFPAHLSRHLIQHPLQSTSDSFHQYADMGVMFLDICDFSESLIDDQDKSWRITYSFFTKIDKILSQYNALRIKTNGDELIVVFGLPNPTEQRSHHKSDKNGHILPKKKKSEVQTPCIKQALRASLEILHEMNRSDSYKVKIGLAFGKVIYGIFDTNNPSFDIWGETVVRASRLESKAGRNELIIDENINHNNREFTQSFSAKRLYLKGLGQCDCFTFKV